MTAEPHRAGLLVEARGVDVAFGGRQVLADVDLAVHEGEIVTLIGPNGAGKSTLVRAVLGLLRPARGSVFLRAGARVGYMPQHVTIDRTLPLTVRRFLALSGGPKRPAILAALDEVGAARVVDGPVQDTSGGEFRRVLLARALLREPDLLVLDEPVQGVDVTGQAELFDVISEIRRRRGCGVLMVSHDLHLVMAATDQVVCLNHHVCCTGHPEAVSRHPAYLALFGPQVAAELAVYSHRHDHRHDAAGKVVPVEAGDAGPENGPPPDLPSPAEAGPSAEGSGPQAGSAKAGGSGPQGGSQARG